MNFVSAAFLGFFVVTLIVYYVIPKKFQWAVILVANYVFYLLSGITHVIFIIFTTLLIFFSALWIQKIRDEYSDRLSPSNTDLSKEEKKKYKAEMSKRVHKVQRIAVLISLAILAFCKYANFVVSNFNSLSNMFSWNASIPYINVIVPLGVSFYTFAAVGYLIDISRGKYRAETHLGKFAAFISFFPTIIQGPICRYNEVGKQLGAEHKLEYDNLKFGAQLMLWGFFLKTVIADRAGIAVTTIFNSDTLTDYNGGIFLLGILFYAVRIYCDFSGGINITIGMAKMMGIDLPKNFERPYFSQTVSEYWRRWHITLGSWMKDYVFYPVMLSKPVVRLGNFSRKKISQYAGRIAPSIITTFVVFFLIGIWHGASWKYIAFGLYNAFIVAGGTAIDPLCKKLSQKLKINTGAGSWHFFCMARTFLVTAISKILVVSPGLMAALYVIKTIFTDMSFTSFFGLDGKIFELGLNQKNMLVLFIGVLILLSVSILQERGMKMRETINKQNLYLRWILSLGLLAVILVFGMYGPGYSAASFIYEAF